MKICCQEFSKIAQSGHTAPHLPTFVRSKSKTLKCLVNVGRRRHGGFYFGANDPINRMGPIIRIIILP